MATYKWEWISDLALIPAWECFLVGVIVGAIITGIIVLVEISKRW